MGTDCPICFEILAEEKKTTATMFMGYIHKYSVYRCQACDYLVDFTVEDINLRSFVMAAAFRKIADEVNSHRKIEKTIMQRYIGFIQSFEFKQYAELWQKNNLSFWIKNQHVLLEFTDA